MRIHNRGRRPQALTRTPPQKQATTQRAVKHVKKMNEEQNAELPFDFLRLMFLSNFFMPKASQYKMDFPIEVGPRFPEIAPLQLHRTQLYFLYMLFFVFNLEYVNAGSSDFSSCPSGSLLGSSEGQSVVYPPNLLHMLQPICPINNGGINPAGVNEADGFQQPEYRSDLRWLGTLVKNGRVKQLERLWDQGEVSASDFNELSRQSGLVPNLEKSVLVYAIGYQDYKLANFLFERGIYDPLYKDDKGNTELMHMLEVVKVAPKFERLLYPYIQKLDQTTINLRNDAGGTALIIAASYGQERVLAELLKTGADPNIRDNHGLTAIWYAVNYPSQGIKDKVFVIVKQLVASQADLHLGTTSMGKSLFFMAVQKGMDSPFLDYLLSKGFDIDARNNQGATPLISVINLNSGNVLSQVNYLINRGAKLNLQLYFEDDPLSPGGVSALILAVQKKMLNVVNELIKKGADLNLRDRNGRSALMFSLYERSDISELLLRTKVELDFQDSEGLSPLM